MKNKDIFLRDPFILVHGNQYYLYGTRSETAFVGQAYGFDTYVSTDLENWDGPYEVFHRPEGFFSKKSYWAPEVYAYHGRFFMFATFADTHQGLGTAVLVSDSPKGPFEMWSDGYVTPKDWKCLDGTLHISPEGIPYMVFCHEFRQVTDGTICAMRLTDDLKEAAGEPWVLFSAAQAQPFVRKYRLTGYVTDGPYLFRTEDGRLHMLWSTYSKNGYVEAMAHSDTDQLQGKWSVDEELLYDHDGGHGMVFRNLNGDLMMSLHYPNTFRREHPVFIRLKYQDGRLKTAE